MLNDEQVDMLVHRLEVPDAICDTLESDWELTMAACDRMRKYILNHRCLPDPEALTQLDKDILQDAVEGSTWFAAIYAQGTKHKVLKAIVDVQHVEKLVGKLVGRKVTCPRW